MDRGELLSLEVALQERIVAGNDLLHDLFVHLVFVGGDIVGERLDVVASVGVVFVRLLGQHVGDTVECRFLAQRQLDRQESRTEGRVQLGEHVLEVGPMLALTGDEHHPWQVAIDALAPCRMTADLESVGSADDQDGQIGHGKGGVDLGLEVGVPRGVEQIDAVALAVTGLPVERRHCQRHARTALDLLGVAIEGARAVVDRARPSRDAGMVEQRFGERGLAHPTVTDQHNVPDLLGEMFRHPVLPRCLADGSWPVRHVHHDSVTRHPCVRGSKDPGGSDLGPSGGTGWGGRGRRPGAA